MTGQKFWTGFVAGTAMGAFAGIAGVLLARRRSADVVRLEKSVNIGRPVQNVFAAWSDFERLPRWIDFIRRVERYGTQTRWLVNMDGREFEWEAQITQVVPNESIGWKSLSGPKHTGRITFSPLGNQTVVHVLMNYAPGLGGFGGFGSLGGFGSMLPIDQHLEQWIDRALREFKQALEREGGARESFEREASAREKRSEFTSPGPGGFNAVRRQAAEPRDWEPVERTGTEDVSSGPVGTPGKHSAPGTARYTRPPEDKS